MSRTPITDIVRDNIALLIENGMTDDSIAKVLSVSASSVKVQRYVMNAVKENDLDAVETIRRNRNAPLAEWVCRKYGITKEEPKAPQADNTAQAVVSLLNAIRDLTVAVESIKQTLDAIASGQATMRGNLDEHFRKVNETINVNGDILTKEHDRMIDILGGIKMNTKKKVYQNGSD